MDSNVIAFAINMICITVISTLIIEKQPIYNIYCIYLRERLRQKDETEIKNLEDYCNKIIDLIKNHMLFFRISIPGFSFGIFLTYYLQQQEQIPYIVECALPTIIMVAVGAIVFIIYNKINPQNKLTPQDISIDMTFSALIFAGCVLSINRNAAVLATFIVIGKYAAFDLLPSMIKRSFSFKEINFLKSNLYVLQRTMFIGYLIYYWCLFIVTNHIDSKEEYIGGLLACIAFFSAGYIVTKRSYLRIIQRLKIEYNRKMEKEKSSKI